MLSLICAHTGELLAQLPTGPALVNREQRLIGGLASPYNVFGTPSGGGAGVRAVFRASSISVPSNRSHVKLLVEHDNSQSVGYMTDADELHAGLVGVYRVAAGASGDAALDGVENRTRDGLSVRVEVDRYNRLPDGSIEVLSSRLRETSLVSVPAFDDARVAALAASSPTERDEVMARIADLIDLKASTPPVADPPVPAPQPAPAAPSVAPTAAAAPAFDMAAFAAALAPLLAAAPPAATEPPAGQAPRPVPPVGNAGPGTIQAAAQTVADWYRRDGGNINTLLAALSDVVPADDAGEGFTRPAWIGELWTASQSRRPYIDSLGTPKPLTSLKIQGWKWVTKPAVGNYAGDKAAIPSNDVVTAPAEATAQRKAGGWDIDRAYIDLGDPAFIQAMFEAATEDYRRKTDVAVGAALLAAQVAGPNDPVEADSVQAALIGMAAQAYAIGAQINWVAIASDLFTDLAGLTKDELPWWFDPASLNIGEQSGNIPGFRFWVDSTLTDGTVLAGDSKAATYYEVGTPIRVQAVNIPNGGVDIGVFGYHGLIVNDARALFAAEPAGA